MEHSWGNDFWQFLRDESNRAVLGWIGTGIVVFVGALWAAFKFFLSDRKPKDPSPSIVSASGGSVAAGRDIRDSKIDTHHGPKR